MRAALVAFAACTACGGPKPPAVTPQPPPAPGSGSNRGGSAASVAGAAVAFEDLHGTIASFAIEGGEDIDYLRLQPLFADEIGKPLDRGRLRGKLDRAMEGETLADLALTGEQLVDGVRLHVKVVPQPKIVALDMRDQAGQPIPLPPRLQAVVGTRLAPAEMDQIAGALRDEYASEGNAGYAASWRTAPSGAGIAVTFETNPGERLLVSAHVYDGAKLVKPAELDKALEGSLAVGSPWIPEAAERGALLVESYYWDHGFANVNVSLQEQPAHNPAPVTYKITEGDIFKLSTIEVTGVSAADAKRYLAMTKLRPGQLFSRKTIADGRRAINDDVIQQGHPKAEVLPLTKVDVKKKTIGLTFEVTPEPKPGP